MEMPRLLAYRFPVKQALAKKCTPEGEFASEQPAAPTMAEIWIMLISYWIFEIVL
jgi:hypothetical protein